jgi:hypothetical protein
MQLNYHLNKIFNLIYFKKYYNKPRFFLIKLILLFLNSFIIEWLTFKGVVNILISGFSSSLKNLFSTDNNFPKEFNLSFPRLLKVNVIKGLLNIIDKRVPWKVLVTTALQFDIL